MTEDELKAIEARAQAATFGPWEHLTREYEPNELGESLWATSEYPKFNRVVHAVQTGWIHGQAHDKVLITGWEFSPYYEGGQYQPHVRSEDAEFIAHARDDVPALIAEIRRLQEGDSHA